MPGVSYYLNSSEEMLNASAGSSQLQLNIKRKHFSEFSVGSSANVE